MVIVPLVVAGRVEGTLNVGRIGGKESALQRQRVRPDEAVRRPGLDRPPERRDAPGRRGRGPSSTALTGLRNHGAFQRELGEAIASSDGVAVRRADAWTSTSSRPTTTPTAIRPATRSCGRSGAAMSSTVRAGRSPLPVRRRRVRGHPAGRGPDRAAHEVAVGIRPGDRPTFPGTTGRPGVTISVGIGLLPGRRPDEGRARPRRGPRPLPGEAVRPRPLGRPGRRRERRPTCRPSQVTPTRLPTRHDPGPGSGRGRAARSASARFQRPLRARRPTSMVGRSARGHPRGQPGPRRPRRHAVREARRTVDLRVHRDPTAGAFDPPSLDGSAWTSRSRRSSSFARVRWSRSEIDQPRPSPWSDGARSPRSSSIRDLRERRACTNGRPPGACTTRSTGLPNRELLTRRSPSRFALGSGGPATTSRSPCDPRPRPLQGRQREPRPRRRRPAAAAVGQRLSASCGPATRWPASAATSSAIVLDRGPAVPTRRARVAERIVPRPARPVRARRS